MTIHLSDTEMGDLVTHLSDERLSVLRRKIYAEEMRRLEEKVQEIQPTAALCREEIDLLIRGDRQGAMRFYRARNDCSLMFAMKVFDAVEASLEFKKFELLSPRT